VDDHGICPDATGDSKVEVTLGRLAPDRLSIAGRLRVGDPGALEQ
jgi:hypothetical protein